MKLMVEKREKVGISKCGLIGRALLGSALLVSTAIGCGSKKIEEPENMTHMSFLNGAKIAGCTIKADEKNPYDKDELAIHIVFTNELPVGSTLTVSKINSQLEVVQIDAFGGSQKVKFPKCKRE